MTVKKQNIGSKEPATQGDIEDLREDLHVDIINTEERIKEELRQDILAAKEETVSEIKEAMLGPLKDDIVGEVKTALQESLDKIVDKQIEHDARITKLEARV